MTKSILALAREALATGRQALPPYGHRFSRHDYTQAQLFALLVLKQALKTDYRGLVAVLAEWGELRQAVGLTRVPHYSTLCYAHQRLLAGEKGGVSPFCSPPLSALLGGAAGWEVPSASPSTPRASAPTP